MAAMSEATSAAGAPLLRVSGLQFVYGRGSVGVEDVSLEVGEAEIVALLGANGAGKSSTLRAISGVLPSERARVARGTVAFAGTDVTGRQPHRLVRLGMALVPERDKIFRSLTVEENLGVGLRGEARRQRAENREVVYQTFPRLHDLRKRRGGHLSGGERQMLGIGRALMLAPRLLLADELSLGIAPKVVEQLMQSLREVNERLGMAILLVEQNASAALSIANRGYVMEVGRIVAEGTPAHLLRDDAIRAAYLGSARAAAADEEVTP